MKPLRILLTIFVLFIGIVVYKDASAVEWQEKPVVCMQKDVLDEGLKERGEVLAIFKYFICKISTSIIFSSN